MAPQPGIAAIRRWFDGSHLDAPLGHISKACEHLADMAIGLGSGPELTAGLRKLLEAKDCFVRAAIHRRETGPATLAEEVRSTVRYVDDGEGES